MANVLYPLNYTNLTGQILLDQTSWLRQALLHYCNKIENFLYSSLCTLDRSLHGSSHLVLFIVKAPVWGCPYSDLPNSHISSSCLHSGSADASPRKEIVVRLLLGYKPEKTPHCYKSSFRGTRSKTPVWNVCSWENKSSKYKNSFAQKRIIDAATVHGLVL